MNKTIFTVRAANGSFILFRPQTATAPDYLSEKIPQGANPLAADFIFINNNNLNNKKIRIFSYEIPYNERILC